VNEGSWVQSAIWTGLSDEAAVVREGIFGPCCPVEPGGRLVQRRFGSGELAVDHARRHEEKVPGAPGGDGVVRQLA